MSEIKQIEIDIDKWHGAFGGEECLAVFKKEVNAQTWAAIRDLEVKEIKRV